MKSSEILTKAGNLIQRRGKATGQFRSTFGRLCAIGALNKVIYDDPYGFPTDLISSRDSDSKIRAKAYLIQAINTYTIIRWSDNSTKKEVVAGFHKAAELAAADGD